MAGWHLLSCLKLSIPLQPLLVALAAVLPGACSDVEGMRATIKTSQSHGQYSQEPLLSPTKPKPQSYTMCLVVVPDPYDAITCQADSNPQSDTRLYN
eukprot:6466568-Amphidinium_carterae.2